MKTQWVPAWSTPHQTTSSRSVASAPLPVAHRQSSVAISPSSRSSKVGQVERRRSRSDSGSLRTDLGIIAVGLRLVVAPSIALSRSVTLRLRGQRHWLADIRQRSLNNLVATTRRPRSTKWDSCNIYVGLNGGQTVNSLDQSQNCQRTLKTFQY